MAFIITNNTIRTLYAINTYIKIIFRMMAWKKASFACEASGGRSNDEYL